MNCDAGKTNQSLQKILPQEHPESRSYLTGAEAHQR
jgi:hypothetical protein